MLSGWLQRRRTAVALKLDPTPGAQLASKFMTAYERATAKDRDELNPRHRLAAVAASSRNQLRRFNT